MAWPHNTITEKLKINYPIIQAPMAGGATTPELIASVCNAGGLGSLGAGYMSAAAMNAAIVNIRKLTNKPFAISLFIPGNFSASEETIRAMQKKVATLCADFLDPSFSTTPPYAPSFEEQMQIVLQHKPAVFSFTFGILNDKWIKELHAENILLAGTATTLAEAKLLESKGIDLIVAQGSEAGGHRGTFLKPAADSLVGTMALVPQLVDQLKTPIIASGGIMDGRGIVAALALGALGVQMGTAFLGCDESGISSGYKKTLHTCSEDKTTLTRVFSGKMARGIYNHFIRELENDQSIIPDYPVQNTLTRPMREAAAKLNLTDYLSLWAGQAACLSKKTSAAELIRILDCEVRKILAQLCVN